MGPEGSESHGREHGGKPRTWRLEQKLRAHTSNHKQGAENTLGMTSIFNSLSLPPVTFLSAWPHLLRFPKQHHQLETKHFNPPLPQICLCTHKTYVESWLLSSRRDFRHAAERRWLNDQLLGKPSSTESLPSSPV